MGRGLNCAFCIMYFTIVLFAVVQSALFSNQPVGIVSCVSSVLCDLSSAATLKCNQGACKCEPFQSGCLGLVLTTRFKKKTFLSNC